MAEKKILNSKWGEMFFFSFLLILSIFLSFPLNFPEGKPQGRGEFYADKAAYYVYLPATFIYHWDLKKFPEKIDEKTRGFTLHYKNDKLIIKTTCGVALMLTPFFIPTHIISKAFDLEPDGFSPFYQKMMTLPGIVYLILGLFFLRRFLENYLSRKITYITVIFLFAGTNLFFYSMDEGLMSHVYSFFLFSVALFLMKRFLDRGRNSFSTFLWLSLVLSLAILIRPTNIIFLLIFPFLDTKSLKEAGERSLFFLNPQYSLTFLVILFLVFIPQMIYWNYISGSYLYYSYQGEGFTNLKHPMILALWFAPLNGLFLYTPLVLCFITGIFYMIIRRIPNGIFIGLLFLFISYLFSSWLTWFFGGSFGSRPFVEYYSLLALPFAYFLDWIFKWKNVFIQTFSIVMIGMFSYYNLKLACHYNCFPGSIWSWDDYKIYLSDAGIQNFPKETYTYINDFENNTFPDEVPRNFKVVHSLTLSSSLDPAMEFNCKYSKRFDRILDKQPEKALAGIWFRSDDRNETGAFFVCSIEDTGGKTLFYRSVNIDKFAEKRGEWKKAEEVFHFPEWIPPTSTVSFYIWNVRRSSFYVDDMTIKFE